MEKLGGSGKPSHTADNCRVPLEPIPKYKKIRLSNGQTKLSPCLASDQIFSRFQHSIEPCLRKSQDVFNTDSESPSGSGRTLQNIHYNNSAGFVQERVGQLHGHGYVTAASVNNYSSYKQRHFGPNDDLLEAPCTTENRLPQICAGNYVINSGSTFTSIQHANVSSATTIPDVSQQAIAQMTVLNVKHLSGNWKNFSNQHQHVITGNDISTEHMQQKMSVDSRNIEPVVILTPAQNVFLQQDIYKPKESRQQECVYQKAIAVVTPLTQQVVTDGIYSCTTTQEKKRLEDESLPCEKSQDKLQIKTRESGLKSLLEKAETDISQRSQSELIQTCGFDQQEEAKGQAGQQQCLNQSERSYSISLNGICGQTKGKTHSSHIAHQSSALENVINHSFEDTAVPVTEWSLRRLHTLISDLEHKQIMHQQDIPFSNVTSQILKLFWNGEHTQLYEASKTNLYCDVMNEARLHSGTNDSVILREIPKEKLNKIALDNIILIPHNAPPKSSWLNLNVKLLDVDEEYGYPPSVTTSQGMPRLDEELVKEQKNLEEGENEKATGTSKLREDSEQSKLLASGNEKKTSATRDMVLNKLRETKGQARAYLSQTTSVDESQDQLPVTLSMNSVAVSRNSTTIKQGFEWFTTDISDDVLRKEKELDQGGNENVNGTTKSRGDAEQSQRLAAGHEKIPSATTESVLKKKVRMDFENVAPDSLRVTKECKRINLSQTTSADQRRTKIRKMASSEEMVETCIRNAETNSGIRDPVSLFMKSVVASDHCATIKQGFEQLSNEMTALLVKSEIADDQDFSAGLKINIMPPEKAKEIFFGDTSEKAETDLRTEKESEDEKYMTAEMKSDEKKKRIHIEMQLKEYCCMAKWLKSLGYINGGHCRCAKEVVLSHTSGRHVNEPDTDNYRRMRSKSQVKDDFNSRKHDDMDEINVKMISNVEDILKLSNTVSDQLKNAPFPLPSIDNVNPTFDEKGRSITKPGLKMDDKLIHIALFGSSLHKMHEPMTKNKIRPKLLKCSKWHTESKRSFEGNADETTAFDVISGLLSHEQRQEPRCVSANYKSAASLTAHPQNIAHGQTTINRCSTQLAKRKRLKKQKCISALFNGTRRQTCANKLRKGPRSPFKRPFTNSLNKSELNKGLALSFQVLPESFNLPGGRSSVETQPPSSTDTGPHAKASTLLKRPQGPPGAWCVSPKKKQHFGSTEIAGSSSTFQEFKKRYQEKRLRLPP